MKYFALVYTFFIILFLSCSPTKQDQIERSKHNFPAEYLYKQREYPVGIKNDIFQKGFDHLQKLKNSPSQTYRADWVQEGPINVPGRIVDIEGTGAPENKIYACTASGGIFLTENEGNTWTPIFDDQITLSIGDMDIAPSNKNILYVGTGESNAGGGSLAYDGFGVFKSNDGGVTWSPKGLESVGSIGRVVIHPTNPDIVYVAAMGSLFTPNEERGIYKTTNGGESWEQVLFISNITGGIDLAVDPSNPDNVYAALWERTRSPETRDYGGPTSGIYKSTNAGTTWSELSNGLPNVDLGRIGIAISESDPEILYTTIADPNGPHMGIYQTIDGGDFWFEKSSENITSVPYMWWFGRIAIHPKNPSLLYHIGLLTSKSTNGGNSWAPEFNQMHVDQHIVWMNPDDENEVWMGNDGGVYLTKNGGDSFISFDLPTTQFYACEIDHLAPSNLYGGAQDNGTNRTLTGQNDDYTKIYGGDGFRVLVDYTDNDIIFAEAQRGFLGKSTDGGNSFVSAKVGIGNEPSNWNTPIAMHPTDPNIMYFGSSRLYRSTNQANFWEPISNDLSDGPYFGVNNYGTITEIGVSANDKVLAGTDDGNIWLVNEAGTLSQVYNSEPRRWITNVSFNPENDNIMYATFSGFRYASTDSQVLMSTDNGQSWLNISGDLPDIPVNDLIVRPDTDEIIIATDLGVFSTINEGTNWLPVGNGLPNVVVTDIDFHAPTRKLVAATYGRSFFSTILEEDPSSTKELNLNVTVYPNPTSDFISIDITNEELTYTIIDGNGRITKKGAYNDRIDVSQLEKGVYTIQLRNKEEQRYISQFLVI
jgi:photosystem II stability/assembly factor-like uncharacterized protein